MNIPVTSLLYQGLATVFSVLFQGLCRSTVALSEAKQIKAVFDFWNLSSEPCIALIMKSLARCFISHS